MRPWTTAAAGFGLSSGRRTRRRAVHPHPRCRPVSAAGQPPVPAQPTPQSIAVSVAIDSQHFELGAVPTAFRLVLEFTIIHTKLAPFLIPHFFLSIRLASFVSEQAQASAVHVRAGVNVAPHAQRVLHLMAELKSLWSGSDGVEKCCDV